MPAGGVLIFARGLLLICVVVGASKQGWMDGWLSGGRHGGHLQDGDALEALLLSRLGQLVRRLVDHRDLLGLDSRLDDAKGAESGPVSAEGRNVSVAREIFGDAPHAPLSLSGRDPGQAMGAVGIPGMPHGPREKDVRGER